MDFLISMFKGKGDTTQLGGPIKIAKITGQVAQHGVNSVFKHYGIYLYKLRIYKSSSNTHVRWWTFDVLRF